jgi:glyoxylase-like metal-dependent hydrolase (beta-lactamase superfamily II)
MPADPVPLAPGINRILAPNPSIMTGPGTNTYLVGDEEVAVIDPGPAIPAHADHIVAAAPGAIRWILVTHTHPDHSPGARMLAERTGAELLGMPVPDGPHQDHTFRPDRELADGDVLDTPEFSLRAVHTPGHASNHVCYLHGGIRWLFTGDHIVDGSTVVINPPDGNMQHYLVSLRKVRALDCAALAPGHGEIVTDPERVIDWIIEHRLRREAKVVAAMRAHPNATVRELVPRVYTDVPTKLFGWAERSLLAHALKLEADGMAESKLGRWRLI